MSGSAVLIGRSVFQLLACWSGEGSLQLQETSVLGLPASSGPDPDLQHGSTAPHIAHHLPGPQPQKVRWSSDSIHPGTEGSSGSAEMWTDVFYLQTSSKTKTKNWSRPKLIFKTLFLFDQNSGRNFEFRIRTGHSPLKKFRVCFSSYFEQIVVKYSSESLRF